MATDTDNDAEAEEQLDQFDEEGSDVSRPANLFKRGTTRNSTSFSRLSTAIRRSLRLSPRAEPNLLKQREDSEWHRLRKADAGPTFTENSTTKIGESSVPSRLTDIRNYRRQNKIDKVKKIIRKADWPVRHEVRKELWRELCNSKDFDSSKALFRSELDDVIRSSTRRQNPQFLKEDGVVINNFELNELGAVKLQRLLAVIEHLRPEISSAPMLYALCALMLHFLDDAEVFASIQYLLVSKGYLMTSPVQWAASSHTILALVKKHKTNAYAMLKRRIGSPDDAVLVLALRDWLTWIFNGLPLPHVVRLIDCFLVEGHKFITRAAIAIVYIWAKGHKSANSRVDDLAGKSQDERIEIVKEELLSTAQHLPISTDTFIETACRIRNLQSATIARFQAQFETSLRDEVSRRISQKKQDKKTRQFFTQAFDSVIVDSEAASEIMSALPPRLQLETPRLVFRLSQDGASFYHLWSRIENAEQTLLLIRAVKGDIFGAYCSSAWIERKDTRERSKSKYFGTGESFVWTLDKEMELPVIYGWVGNQSEQPDSCPQMFQTANDKLIIVGSGDGDAIRISDELTEGMSSACKTFGSPALCEGRAFTIHELEVFEVTTGS